MYFSIERLWTMTTDDRWFPIPFSSIFDLRMELGIWSLLRWNSICWFVCTAFGNFKVWMLQSLGRLRFPILIQTLIWDLVYIFDYLRICMCICICISMTLHICRQPLCIWYHITSYYIKLYLFSITHIYIYTYVYIRIYIVIYIYEICIKWHIYYVS